ncbi:hypothetical protein [Flavobacterium sp. CSZ]|uniref:hypothetical protein n=1 Tax=Flavobacterium sp. CSZ TaxID=2783791 RepID=UPI00188D8A6F|nr:hypothetical protein [Flavobacterium sp. CSZ]MBF4486678.1 hypothetical protein [Flavobacterium sp. CSZ]
MNKEETSEKHLYELTTKEESSIEISRAQIKNGKFHKNEDVISEMKKWLKTIA